MKYTSQEMMVVCAARQLNDDDVVLVGVGLPNLACNLARLTHAPSLTMIYESGVIGATPERLPLSIGDPALASGAVAICSMHELFSGYLQRGLITVGFLGGAQIDRYGHINATVIGDYANPDVRLPGSGGSMEIAAWAGRVYILTPHQQRRFPEKVDFRTSQGQPADDRAALGLRGRAPEAVVTDLAILRPSKDGELQLSEVHPGVRQKEVRDQTGWPLKSAKGVMTTEPPGENELDALRKLDPERMYLG